jgi:alpha-tubulin suppressor-like RCC1 family protein
LSNIIAVAAGDKFSLALQSDGTVWAWGDNTTGQIGTGSTGAAPVSTPTVVSGLPEIVSLAAGHHHALAIGKSGMVWSWGDNGQGQLGQDPLAASVVPTPAKVYNLTGVVGIAAGREHSLAARTDGTIWAWGYNDFGYLGVPSPAKISQPIQIPLVGEAVAVAAGNWTNYLIRSDGFVMAWGNNVAGQCGVGHLNPVPGPTVVPTLTSVSAIAAGGSHGLSLREDGTVAAWGPTEMVRWATARGRPTTSRSKCPISRTWQRSPQG